MTQQIDAFVDWGFDEGTTFAKLFLASPEFLLTDLRALAAEDAGLSKTKEGLATQVVERWVDGQTKTSAILEVLAERRRKLLSIRLGQATGLPNLADPAGLLTAFGNETWYGPFGPESRWYLRIFQLPHHGLEGAKAVAGRVRWMVFAQVLPTAVLYSWSGLTTKEEDAPSIRHLQYPFWKVVPGAIAELEKQLGGSFSTPPLHDLVINRLWDQYMFADGFQWRHVKVNAESFGVSLNAKSAPIELNISGLDSLTAELAKAALRALNQPHNDEAERAIALEQMRTILQSWGASSYEFQLDRVDQSGHHPEMKAHCFFGLRPEKLGHPDSFQHIRCYVGMGGATGTAQFFLHHLGISV